MISQIFELQICEICKSIIICDYLFTNPTFYIAKGKHRFVDWTIRNRRFIDWM